MPPEFSKSVVDVIAKRAAMMCSNIECRTLTSGPADSLEKSVNIGEAAHIYGAKEGAARYRPAMTDVSRAEMTNAIWLCRNCHKLVDSDPDRFPPELLYQWRGLHEQYVVAKLGTPNDQLRLELEVRAVDQFREDSALVRQIVRDRPLGWEYRLTAEFLRNYLRRAMRGWSDLQRALYSRPATILAEESSLAWFKAKLSEAQRMAPVLVNLYTKELARAWGQPGQAGDAMEIKHVCKLIQSAAEQMLQWEESVHFVSTIDLYVRLFACLRGAVGRQLDQLDRVTSQLDEVADWVDSNPGEGKVFSHTIVFDLPDGWADRIATEFKRIERANRWF